MLLTSPAFRHHQPIPPRFTCDGENIVPELDIDEIPVEARSLVIIIDDPDSPMRTWLHWSVWNIDPTTKAIHEGHLPSGAREGMTSFGSVGYGGPCPGQGEHRYFFRLYALDNVLNLQSGANRHGLESTMRGHEIDQTELMGTYKRQ